MLSHFQADRIHRANQDAIFLLDSNIDMDTGCLSVNICGNSRNVYRVSLSRTHDGKYQWGCNCPDMLTHARKSGCICKHVCFLIYKVVRVTETESEPLTTRGTFSMDETIHKQFVTKLHNRADLPTSVFDQGLALTFTDKTQTGRTLDAFLPNEDARTDDATCPICFDSIDTEPLNHKTSCHMCPACKNLVHKTCMSKYATHKKSQVSCIYCRSTAWMNLYAKQGPYLRL